MESLIIQNKFKLLFEQILQPGYVMNNYYADGLINKLANHSDPEILSLKSSPISTELITQAFSVSGDCHKTVKVFIIRALAIVTSKELEFIKIFCVVGNEISEAYKKLNKENSDASLKVSFLELAIALSQHNSGTAWLRDTDTWREIMKYCYEKTTVFVLRKAHRFITNFLWRLNDMNDENSIKLVLSVMLEPFDCNFLKEVAIKPEDEELISAKAEPMLQALNCIIREGNRITSHSLLITVLCKDFTIIMRLHVFMDMLCRRSDLTLLVAQIVMQFSIAKIFLAKPLTPDVIYTDEDVLDVSAHYYNCMQGFITRGDYISMLDFSNACLVIWGSLFKEHKVYIMRHDRKIEFSHQLLLLCLVPCVVYVKEDRKKNASDNGEDDNLENYIFKLIDQWSELTIKTAYAIKKLILQLDRETLMLQNVKRLNCLKNHLNNEQANFLFQTMFYILKSYAPLHMDGDPSNEESYEEDQNKGLVMTYVMDTVLVLLRDYDISWTESVEIVCLYNVVAYILKRRNLPCRLVTSALSVITMTVKKFQTPNLCLLLEPKPGTQLNEIGQLIYMKMHDVNWEIRDSALELLLVCTELAYIKFPSFQKIILENNLLNIAMTLVLNNPESYVQASALKCIGAATKVNSLWDHLEAEFPNIQAILISIQRNHDEGIVRKEACSVLSKMYQNIMIAPAFKLLLYEHMTSTALSDFHWETQINALKFWKIVIFTLFSDQGMLDGTFPAVTFSRETRKIVTLNEREIQKRILKTLEQLSSIGCLTILIKLLHDESEVAVMKLALSISQELFGIINQYNMEELMNENSIDISIDEVFANIKEVNEDVATENTETMVECDTSDNVIEGILNADDLNLLADIYETQMNLDNKPELKLKPRVKLSKNATPKTFVNFFREKDFKDFIEARQRWNDGIRSLSSLLDDVLGIYEIDNEVNSLDCY